MNYGKIQLVSISQPDCKRLSQNVAQKAALQALSRCPPDSCFSCLEVWIEPLEIGKWWKIQHPIYGWVDWLDFHGFGAQSPHPLPQKDLLRRPAYCCARTPWTKPCCVLDFVFHCPGNGPFIVVVTIMILFLLLRPFTVLYILAIRCNDDCCIHADTH